MGELGRLQKIREDALESGRNRGDLGAGEAAVDKEIERLVRETENVAESEEPVSKQGGKMDLDEDEERRASMLENSAQSNIRRESIVQRQAPREQKRKAINLDLGFGDDDED
jgi:hypothetical protein